MDTASQMQAVVDRLTGASLKNPLAPAALDQPWRTVYSRVVPAAGRAEAEILIRDATRDLPRGRHLARDLIALLPPDGAFDPFPSLHDVSARFPPVDWLWPSWIPNAMVTLFGGAPGAGKSLVALDLARRIIGGESFPDGAPVPCPGSNVLVVDAEGAPALLDRRARAWNVDRRRLFLMLAPDTGDLVNLADPAQQVQLVRMCGRLQPALVVIDSLAAATDRGETSLEGARSILGFLALLAQMAGPAILVVHHLRKRAASGRSSAAARVAADDLRGSSHLSAAARSVLALSMPVAHPTPALAGMRRLEVVKTNLCRLPSPLGLILEDPLDLAEGSRGGTGGPGLTVPSLRYTGYVEPPAPPTQRELCGRWLLEFLAAAGAPVRPADLIRAATGRGFSQATLYRARRALAGSIVDLGTGPRDPNNRWALATPPHPTPRVDDGFRSSEIHPLGED